MGQNIPRILIADHDAERLFKLAALFDDSRFHILTARGVQQAVDVGIREPLDLLLAPRKLKSTTGLDLIRGLRCIRRHHRLTALFYCGGQQAAIKLATEDGFPTYVVRDPFCADTIVKLIDWSLAFSSRCTSVPIPIPHAAFGSSQPSAVRSTTF